jgi:hypothetical protein
MPLPGSPTAMSRGTRGSTSHVAFLCLRRGQPKFVMTYASPGMGVTLFPPGSPPKLSPLEKGANVMNFFYHGAIPVHVFDRVRVMWTGHFKKSLKVIFEHSSLPLEVTWQLL